MERFCRCILDAGTLVLKGAASLFWGQLVEQEIMMLVGDLFMVEPLVN